MMKTQKQIPQRHQQGQSLAEFSLILPILLLVVFGIIDFGRVLFVYSNVSGELRDAARYAAVLGFDSSAPEYAKCGEIEQQALNAMFVSDEVVDIYYWDTTSPDTDVLTEFDPNLYTTQQQVLASAHYACNGGATLDPAPAPGSEPDAVDPTGSQFENGDILRVHYTGRIGFMTPFLSAVWSGIDLDFFAQRTIITQITLGSSDGIDYDYDGLDDRWEFMWFGCMDEDDDIWLVADEYRFADVSTWLTWKIYPTGGSSSSAVFWYDGDDDDDNDICEIRMVEDPEDDTLEVPMPATVVLAIDDGGTNAIRDIDLDGCNSGCEELRNAQPIDYFDHDGTDTDRDGLNDGNEANEYYTDPTGGDFHRCHNNELIENQPDGVPDGYDSDCDGVPDGVEVGSDVVSPDVIIQPNGMVEYPGKEGTGNFGYPYRPSDAFSADANPEDGIFDSVDSDGDTLYDHAEYYDSDPCVESTYDTGRPIPTDVGRAYTFAPGTPYECHPDLNPLLTTSFPTNENLLTLPYLTSSAVADENSNSEPDGMDTDNDDIHDNLELAGFVRGPFSINRQSPQTYTYYTHPNYADGDNDGLLDGEEVDIPAPYGGYTNPQNADTDGDGLTDFQEVDTYGTNPLDNDGDMDNLPDNIEIDLLGEYGWGPPLHTGNPSPSNSNSDGTTGSGTDSDGNGAVDPLNPATGELLSGETLINPNACDQMNDGFEADTLGTDPTRPDTDEDGISDCKEEMDIFLNALDPDFDNDGVLDGADCDPRVSNPSQDCGSTADSDGDGLPDSWETTWLGGIGGTDTATLDPDVDGCNNDCEYQRGTNPSGDDNNTCIFNPVTNNRTVIIGTPDTIADGLDTDCDGLDDMEDPIYNGYPSDEDSDNDGLYDGTEAFYTYGGTSYPLLLRNSNSDNDELLDNEEFYLGSVCGGLGTNAADSDTDNDDLFDHLEVAPLSYLSSFPTAYANLLLAGTFTATNPCSTDSDGDTWSDGHEIYLYTGANPNEPDTDGDGIQDNLEFTANTIYWIFDVYTCVEDGNGLRTGVRTGSITSPIADGMVDGLDTDCDNLNDGDEYYNPSATDLRNNTPFDGLAMAIVLCEGTAEELSFNITITTISPTDYDSDNAGLGDGLSDGDEFYNIGTDPQLVDTDGDDEGDGVEVDENTDPLCGGTVSNTQDNDGDGYTNIEEQAGFDLDSVNAGVGSSWTSASGGLIVTDPDNADSDGDGLDDPDEITGHPITYTYYNTSGSTVTLTNQIIVTNPTHLNEDGDSLPDGRDSDDDGINDGIEFGLTGTSTISIDCNGDGDYGDTNEATNVTRITNPAMYDTDGDGMPDGAEVANHTDPLRASCGPTIIFNKIGDQLETGLEMYWHFPSSGTESMTNREAEEQAVLYIDTYYVTNLGSAGAGVFPATMTMTVGFVGSQSCNAGGGSGLTTLTSVIQAGGGTNISTSGTTINGKCMLTADVTFAQLIVIAFNSYITQVIDQVTSSQV
jgi:hypothetical protein